MSYELLPFNEESFASSLEVGGKTSLSKIKSKSHFKYFLKKYLAPEGLDAKTILVEKKYISKDYISDYSKYYATCFTDYKKDCKRLHFFSETFTEQEFEEALKNDNTGQQIWDSYLGFIVVKPIPVTIFGMTILNHYPKEDGEYSRYFFGTRNYKVHVFGKELCVSSIGFQEQDHVLSVCATSAIWTTLQKASLNENTILKTPNEITISSGLTGPDGSRLFPNTGLSVLQMCTALTEAGLVTEIREINKENYSQDNLYIKELIHAYSPIGIPIILVISLNNPAKYDKNRKKELHAVSVVGYNIRKEILTKAKTKTLSLRSESSNKLYVHDDQYGPFARMELKGSDKIISPWDEDNDRKTFTIVEHVIIPLYPKIRIQYEDVKKIVQEFDEMLMAGFSKIKLNFVWELKLEYSEDYKSYVRDSKAHDDLKLPILKCPLPKYIWKATAYFSNVVAFDIIFDATDLSNNMFALKVLFYQKGFLNEVKELVNYKDDLRKLFKNDKYFDFFKNSF